MYHEIADHGDKYALDRQSFLEHINYMERNGMNAISIKDTSTLNYSKNNIVLTFDDGFVSDVWAGEELAKLGFTATFFLVEDFIKNTSNNYMNKNQVKLVASMGHEIGVHGKNHDAWTSKPKKQLLSELNNTKSWLEDLTGTKVDTCSAPGGKLNKGIVSALQTDGNFKHVRNSIPWFTNIASFEVNSTAILQEDSLPIFIKKLEGEYFYYKYLYSKQLLKDQVKKMIGRY